MLPGIKKVHFSFIILLSFVVSACDMLDFIPGYPTTVPGTGPIFSSTPGGEQFTPTAPGFPTQPSTATQSLPVEIPTDIPTLMPAQTAVPLEPSVPLPPSATPRPEPFFVLQPGSPQPLINIARPELGCNWMGIGGQIFDLQGAPLANYLVRVDGLLGNESIMVLGLTGGTSQLGPGGYLLEIASQPVESSGMLYLQVLDLAGRVLSDKVFITTYSDCDKNLILLNFTQLPPGMDNTIYLPAVNKD